MRFDSDTRTRLIATMTLDFNPTGSTVEVEIDGVWYPATWQGTAVEGKQRRNGATVDTWTQQARTDGYFAGPDVASPGSAVVLTLGTHLTQTRVTSGGDVIAENSNRIDVTT